MPEYRRILLDGAAVETVRDGDELVAADGRRVNTDDAHHLPPWSPPRSSPSTSTTAAASTSSGSDCRTPHLLPQADLGTELPQGRDRPPRGLHMAQLRGRGRHRHRPDRPQHLPGRGGEYIAGYTVANDYGLHDFRDTDAGSMLRVKGSDTLCPLGPGLVTDWDFHGKRLRTYVNGEVVQDGSTDEMAWDMHYLVADIARTITLYPGDVLLSGTPANSRPVRPGDVVEVEVEGLGRLTNHIVTGPTAIRADVGAQPTESEEVLSTALGGDWEFRGIRPPRR
ncbi:hypothetical protein SHKM778_55060 [Streptomyces sp. KM77-8]|uniref:Fumarylacetoacetase-like C-terminal domain-containing protein n=1 Tax=Streptomyces haneummycinicus TaxID=3074435 RepID=A0AAT9HP35_9ACTN